MDLSIVWCFHPDFDSFYPCIHLCNQLDKSVRQSPEPQNHLGDDMKIDPTFDNTANTRYHIIHSTIDFVDKLAKTNFCEWSLAGADFHFSPSSSRADDVDKRSAPQSMNKTTINVHINKVWYGATSLFRNWSRIVKLLFSFQIHEGERTMSRWTHFQAIVPYKLLNISSIALPIDFCFSCI